MFAPPRADAWVVERLREAAAIAIERGAPDAALAHLQRAQAEPPAPELRSALTLELGAAAEFVRGTAAAEALARAHAGLTDPVARGDGRDHARPHAAVHGEPGRGDGRRRRRARELPRRARGPDLALRAIRIVGVFFGVADPANLAELEAWRAGPRSQGPGAKTLTAITSLAVAVPSSATPRGRGAGRRVARRRRDAAFDRGISRCCPRRCWR